MIVSSNPMGCSPFLRWAGGKTWLIKHISQFLPVGGFNSYHEPFLGGGAVFFHLRPNKAFLSDLNVELIETYQCVRDNVEGLISELKRFSNDEECYYRERSVIYTDLVKKAARFIFLNQTSFNGIYRVNLKGQYNVPYGYRRKDFISADNLRAISAVLSNVSLKHQDFNDTLEYIGSGDLVFLDPPYTVTHNNNGFIKYNEKLFDLKSQYSLSNFIDEIKRKGAYYILTNAAHEDVKQIFAKDDDRIIELSRASLIGGRNASRGKYNELIITNTI